MSLLVVIALIIMVIQVDAISKIHHLLLNFVQSINENEETQYPENLNNSQKARYKQKFSKDFIVEPFNNQLTIFYQPHIQRQENQRIKIGLGLG